MGGTFQGSWVGLFGWNGEFMLGGARNDTGAMGCCVIAAWSIRSGAGQGHGGRLRKWCSFPLPCACPDGAPWRPGVGGGTVFSKQALGSHWWERQAERPLWEPQWNTGPRRQWSERVSEEAGRIAWSLGDCGPGSLEVIKSGAEPGSYWSSMHDSHHSALIPDSCFLSCQVFFFPYHTMFHWNGWLSLIHFSSLPSVLDGLWSALKQFTN